MEQKVLSLPRDLLQAIETIARQNIDFIFLERDVGGFISHVYEVRVSLEPCLWLLDEPQDIGFSI